MPPELYGGIERIVDMLAQGLVARGHEVTLFAHPDSTCPVPHIAWPGKHSRNALDTFRNTAALTRKVTKGDFDLVHSFSRLAYMTPFLPSSLPKLMTYQRDINATSVALGHRLSRGTLEFSAIGRWMTEPMQHKAHWHFVPNGVPLETYNFAPTVPDDAPLVFLGRIEEIKGPHLAIDIAKRTNRKLVIAGNIPDEHAAWVTAHVEPHMDGEQIQYVGPVDDAQKNTLLGSAAAFLMPILWDEPFGIVMAEAMACGTPVLGLRRGAVPEVVEDGVTGFVRDTVDELVETVTQLPAIDRTACRARVEALYSEDAVVEGYLALYRQMLGIDPHP